MRHGEIFKRNSMYYFRQYNSLYYVSVKEEKIDYVAIVRELEEEDYRIHKGTFVGKNAELDIEGDNISLSYTAVEKVSSEAKRGVYFLPGVGTIAVVIEDGGEACLYCGEIKPHFMASKQLNRDFIRTSEVTPAEAIAEIVKNRGDLHSVKKYFDNLPLVVIGP